MLGLRSPSLDSALRASLRLSKIAPGDFVATLTPTYMLNDRRRVVRPFPVHRQSSGKAPPGACVSQSA